jgi:hypothetical protein
MGAAAEPAPSEDQTGSGAFLCGFQGEARVLCSIASHGPSSRGAVCSGYMVEWLWLTSPSAPQNTAAAPLAGDSAARRQGGSADAGAEARARDGPDFVPAVHMHGGRFGPA